MDFDELLIGVGKTLEHLCHPALGNIDLTFFCTTGGKCGSTYIDRNLHTLLSKRFGSNFDDLPFAQKGPGSRFMMSFEKCKRDFGLSDDKDTQEVGPIRLNLPDSEHYDEDERMVKLT